MFRQHMWYAGMSNSMAGLGHRMLYLLGANNRHRRFWRGLCTPPIPRPGPQ